MSFEFLSDEWFTEVEKIRDEAGDLEIPAQMADLKLNLRVTTDNGDIEMALNGGNLERGSIADAGTTIILPADLAKKLFIDQDQSAGMQGFMSGQIKVEGDMSKMMSLQSVQPSAKQKELSDKIAAMTA
ncbi:MAG TPA: SCP2 sterol-binding domain-containing protein [Pseudomonadales bacterium]